MIRTSISGETNLTDSPEPLPAGVIRELNRGVVFLNSIGDETYTVSRTGTGSVGGHIRHNLDLVNCVLNGIEERRVDYGRRKRDTRIEIDRSYAIEQIQFAIGRLSALISGIISTPILVRSEIDEDTWLNSTVARELEFLHSHTIHHYALIAERLYAANINVDVEFGVAPSTLRFWKEQAVSIGP